MNDTSPAAQARYDELLRAQTPAQRGVQLGALNAAARALVRAGILLQHPDASEVELAARVAVRLYGRELATCWFAFVPTNAQ